jgi:hypothetical protein
MPIASWLFIRGSESIWIERPFGTTLIVAGPGPHRQKRLFINEKELQRFQIALAEDLSARGWFLWAYNGDRRQRDQAIPTGRDRRLKSQGSPRRSRPGATPPRKGVLSLRRHDPGQ